MWNFAVKIFSIFLFVGCEGTIPSQEEIADITNGSFESMGREGHLLGERNTNKSG